MSSGGELELQRNVDKVARDRGWRRFALPTMRRTRGASSGSQESKGWIDRCYFRGGYVIVIEFKPEKEREVTAEQRVWLDEWRAVASMANDRIDNLIRVAVVRPSDYDEVVRWFA